MGPASRPGSPKTPPSAGRNSWLPLIVTLLLCGCRTASLPPLNFNQPGWKVQHGQAVWTVPDRRLEIAGEVLAATHPDGHSVIQFSKTPFPLVEARVAPEGWSIHFVAEGRLLSGRGMPSARLGWLQLARARARSELASPWQFQAKGEEGWILSNQATGEMIEGYLSR